LCFYAQVSALLVSCTFVLGLFMTLFLWSPHMIAPNRSPSTLTRVHNQKVLLLLRVDIADTRQEEAGDRVLHGQLGSLAYPSANATAISGS
jgi:hypothetical protein